ncbi:MAG: PA domain-containing protein [Eubacteriales bacterium]
MKKIKKNTVAAVLVLVLLLYGLNAFPLAAQDTEHEMKFDGGGTVVAVLSGGFSGTDDARFAAGFSGKLTKKSVRDMLPSLEGKGIYINARFPYAYDYTRNDTDLTGAVNLGMTLCDIIATAVPAAQIIPMKIYDDKGALSNDAVCRALRDAFLLGTSVILLDIAEFAGTDDGSELDEDVAALIAEAEERGIAVVCAAGNNGRTGTQSVYQSNYGIEYPSAARQDYGTVSAPSSIASVFSAGSRESRTYNAPCISYGENIKITFSDSTPNYNIAGSHTFTTFFNDRTLEYVPVEGTGTPQDCASAGDMNGKIAIIQRGDLTFVQKINNAADCGAVGVIIYDNIKNNTDSLLMALEGAVIPAIFITYENGLAMLAETDRHVTIKDGETIRLETRNGGSVSSFSSRGMTPSLEIKPELIAEGGSRNIILFGDESKETAGSDTLFSAAEIAAKIAALTGYYRANGIKYDIASLKLALMNAASPVSDSSGTEYSPRAQGAGAIDDLTSLLHADSLIYGADGTGKITLGDKLHPSFPIKCTVRNTSAKTMNYKLSVTAAGDDYTYYKIGDNGLAIETDDKAESEPGFPAFITEQARKFTGALVTQGDVQKAKGNLNSCSESYEPASITLKAGESREITLLFVLDSKTAQEYASVFPNGYFIDGYITLTSEDCNTSSIPYSGFCGSFGRLDAVDSSVYDPDSYYGATYFYSESVEYGQSSEVWLGYNRNTPEILFKKELTAFSPNGDGYADSLSFAFCLLRNVSDVSFVVSDKAGGLFTHHVLGDLKKSFADKFILGKYRAAIWDGKAADNPSFTYPDGKYTMTVSAVPAGGTAQTYSLPFVIDTAAPVLGSFDFNTDKDGERNLTAEISDGHYISRVRLYTSGNKDGEYESVQIFDKPVSEYSCEFNITGVKSEFLYLEIADYAFNMETYRIDLNN